MKKEINGVSRLGMAYDDHYPEIQKANGGYTCEKKASGTVSGI